MKTASRCHRCIITSSILNVLSGDRYILLPQPTIDTCRIICPLLLVFNYHMGILLLWTNCRLLLYTYDIITCWSYVKHGTTLNEKKIDLFCRPLKKRGHNTIMHLGRSVFLSVTFSFPLNNSRTHWPTFLKLGSHIYPG